MALIERATSGSEISAPPLSPEKEPYPKEVVLSLVTQLGADLRRKVYGMREFKEELKRQQTAQRTLSKFEADFNGVHYNHVVIYEPTTSLLDDRPSKFIWQRSWTDLDLGPRPEDKVVISETAAITQSRSDPEIIYIWQRSDKPQDTRVSKNNLEAEMGIRGFMLF